MRTNSIEVKELLVYLISKKLHKPIAESHYEIAEALLELANLINNPITISDNN